MPHDRKVKASSKAKGSLSKTRSEGKGSQKVTQARYHRKSLSKIKEKG